MSEVVATTAPAVAYFADRVKRRLASGFYQTEPAACFCGETKGQPFRQVDRYGIPHQMNFCGSCGILYASPRMTPESLRTFYEQDYRDVYDCGLTEDRLRTAREIQKENGQAIKELVTRHGVIPRVVFELGCNEGGTLDAFLNAGIECLGADYDADQAQTGLAAGRPILKGGIDVLESYGKQADLIIASHVLEHVPDLEQTIMRLRGLLAPGGLLFVALPTLYVDRPENLWQNAHLWQFTARTLSYVMECCGFEDLELEEGIISLWKKTDEVRDKSAVNAPEVYRIAKFLNGGRNIMPMVRTVNKFDRELRERHLKMAIESGRPNIHPLINTKAGKEAVIIGGGPSIDGEIQRLASFRDHGDVIIAIERMLPWCLANGIMPDYVVAMDAHEDVVEAFDRVPTEPTYLVALQCHPWVFDRLKDATVYTFATPQKDIDQEAIFKSYDRDWTRINAGGSVVICAMSLALLLGSRSLHIFGFDCLLGEQPYAKGIAGVGEIAHVITIEIDGYPDRKFTTTVPYMAFAQQFIELVELCRRKDCLDRAVIYGESLVKYIAKPHPLLVL